MSGTIWPWARVAPQGRTFLWLAILLISASGLITGLALHSFAHGMGGTTPRGGGGTTSSITPAAGTATATLAPAVTTPQQFAVALDVPAPTAHGATMTVIARATVAGKAGASLRPAQGVVCQITITPADGIPLPSAQTTDVSGTASFAIVIPDATVPGTYTVHVHATWGTGGFAANWDVLAKVT